MHNNKPLLVVILGPTAVGKTQYGIALAKQINGEIISGDSMQVYRHMDIGTAKASAEQQAEVPHHLIDIKQPDESFSAAEFQQRASELILHITARGRIPIIVGGTGLYIESLCYQFDFKPVGRDEVYRQQLERLADEAGNEALLARLQEVDPLSASRIHPHDRRRLIRALEVFHLTGTPISSELREEEKRSPYRLCLFGLTMDRSILYKRIEERIDLMIENGLITEVEQLLAQGFGDQLQAMQAIGYKEIIGYIRGDYDREEAIRLLKRNTRRFAKRQLSWFRKMKDIHWLDVSDMEKFDNHLSVMNGIIREKGSTF